MPLYQNSLQNSLLANYTVAKRVGLHSI